MFIIFATLGPFVAQARPTNCESWLKTPEQRAMMMNAAHAELKPLAQTPPVRLNLATWNLNMLKKEVRLGLWSPKLITPGYHQRSLRLPEILDARLGAASGLDVLMLQEVWTKEDQATVSAAAARWGYALAEIDLDSAVTHGMQVLIRDRSARVLARGFEDMDPAQRALFESVGRVRRGLLWTKIKLADGQTSSSDPCI
ncbi:MAG: endonuclease/exonuclease/phosphatase family protein [Calothrix sp. SM1_5_4]|nr:endonuclease/exonuclease/phosphatase family protein [Calothrix sp. SM1_5_4]